MSSQNYKKLNIIEESKSVLTNTDPTKTYLSIDNDQTEEWHESSENIVTSAFQQLRIIAILGWPNCIERFASFFPGFVILLFYGHMGPNNIAGAGLGFMFGNVTGLSIIIGFALGLSPLCSHAFGAGNYKRCGDLLQRQILIHLLLILPLVTLTWWNCENILIFLKQPPIIANLCAKFLLWRLPALPFFCISEDITSFVKSQRVFVPTMMLMVSLGIFTIFLAGLLILPQGLGLGFIGGPIALTCSNIIQTSTLLFKSHQLISKPETWPQWNLKTALSGWGELLNLSLPSALMMWGEWWAWEITVFLAGLICAEPSYHSGEGGACIQIEVLTIVSNTMMLAYYFHSGYSNSAGSHIGNLLGYGDSKGALMATRVCIAFVAMISLLVAIVLICIRHQWGKLFSDDPEVHDMVSHAILVVAGYLICDAVGPGALKNILIVLGEVHVPAMITMVCFYVIGLPLSVYLTFGPPYWNNVYGIWVGLLVGVVFMIFGFSVVLCRVDYAVKAKESRKRALEEANIESS